MKKLFFLAVLLGLCGAWPAGLAAQGISKGDQMVSILQVSAERRMKPLCPGTYAMMPENRYPARRTLAGEMKVFPLARNICMP